MSRGPSSSQLLATPDRVLDRMDQLAMEIHGADERFLALVRKLKRTFHLVHLHYNNQACSPRYRPLPAWAYQVLFVNKRIGVRDPTRPAPTLPHPLDAADYSLGRRLPGAGEPRARKLGYPMVTFLTPRACRQVRQPLALVALQHEAFVLHGAAAAERCFERLQPRVARRCRDRQVLDDGDFLAAAARAFEPDDGAWDRLRYRGRAAGPFRRIDPSAGGAGVPLVSPAAAAGPASARQGCERIVKWLVVLAHRGNPCRAPAGAA